MDSKPCLAEVVYLDLLTNRGSVYNKPQTQIFLVT